MTAIAPAAPAGKAPHPVAFEVEYPERLSRLTTLFRLILVIPQYIVVALLGTVASVISVIAWFAILFTGTYPKGLFDFSVGVMRWSANVGAYTALLRDEYPPFSTDAGLYPVTVDVPYPEGQSRLKLFVRFFTLIPNQFVFFFVQLAWYFTTFISWLAILITGRYPKGLHDFSIGVLRWQLRSQAYSLLLRDEYPPYGIRREAPPGNELVSGIIGLPIVAALVALYVVVAIAILGSETQDIRVGVPLASSQLATERPSGEANGIRITLLGYDDDPTVRNGDLPTPGYRFVSFDFLAEKDAFLPRFFSAGLFELHDCLGESYFPDDASGGSWFEMFWTGGENEGTVYFEVRERGGICQLTYHTPIGEIRFIFTGGV